MNSVNVVDEHRMNHNCNFCCVQFCILLYVVCASFFLSNNHNFYEALIVTTIEQFIRVMEKLMIARVYVVNFTIQFFYCVSDTNFHWNLKWTLQSVCY